MVSWAQYADFMTSNNTILAPHPLPSIYNCKLGLTVALVEKKLTELLSRLSFYAGEDDDMRLNGDRIFLSIEDGNWDPRLACQVALKNPESE